MKNPRDKQQINTLARQISPENSRFICEAFKDATDKPYGYLLLDLHQTTPESFRVHKHRVISCTSHKRQNNEFINTKAVTYAGSSNKSERKIKKKDFEIY